MIALKKRLHGNKGTMSNTRRILIATPLKGDIPKSYFRTSLQMATAQVPDVKLDWILLDGPAVQIARNEIAHYAVEQKFDELIFWDKDVLAMRNGEDVTGSALMRLISHDRDIVTAVYSSRSLDTHWHVHPIKGEEPDEAGLQRVERASIGFCKIKVPVFKKIALANVDRVAMLVDPNKAPKLDPKLLARFPVGYRHLAYLQTKVGYKVKDDGTKVRIAKTTGEEIQ